MKISTKDVEELRVEAVEAGDETTVLLCDIYLGTGDASSYRDRILDGAPTVQAQMGGLGIWNGFTGTFYPGYASKAVSEIRRMILDSPVKYVPTILAMSQPEYTSCTNCGSADHNGFSCPCACH